MPTSSPASTRASPSRRRSPSASAPARASTSTWRCSIPRSRVLANQAMNYLASGTAPTRLGNAHPNIVPYQVFAVADGHVIVAVGNDGQFRRFWSTCSAGPNWPTTRSSATNAARVANRDGAGAGARRELIAQFAGTTCSAGWRRRTSPPGRSTASSRSSPTRRSSIAPCGSTCRMAAALPCPRCAARCSCPPRRRSRNAPRPRWVSTRRKYLPNSAIPTPTSHGSPPTRAVAVR